MLGWSAPLPLPQLGQSSSILFGEFHHHVLNSEELLCQIEMLRSLHTASHLIQSLTLSLTICQAQKDLWNKLMGQTLKYKVKMTQKQLTILLLNKLKQNCLSTLGINKYLKFEKMTRDQRFVENSFPTRSGMQLARRNLRGGLS